MATDMYFLSDDELRNARPEYILNRMLSTKSYMLTNEDDTNHDKLTQIGKGQCGTIYTLRGTSRVIKLPNGPYKVAELLLDGRLHAAVERAFRDVDSINVPGFHQCVGPTTQAF